MTAARIGILFVALACLSPLTSAEAAGLHVKVTGNVALVPPAPGVVVSRLPKRRVHVSPARALQAAKHEWHLQTKQVDEIVRGAASDDSNYGAGWLVVADLQTHSPAPGNSTVYSKIVVVVSGTTGKVIFSYPAEPAQSPITLGTAPGAR